MNRVSAWIAWGAVLTAAWGAREQDDARAEIAGLEKRVEALEKYAQTQAKAAEALAKAVEESDAKGFTYGINPDSRKVLLAGLRGVATAAQQGVPGKAEAPAPAPAEIKPPSKQ